MTKTKARGVQGRTGIAHEKGCRHTADSPHPCRSAVFAGAALCVQPQCPTSVPNRTAPVTCMATGQASDICVWNRGAVGLTCARAVLLTNTTPALRRNAVAIFDIVLFLFEELVCTGPALQKADTQELLHDRCYFPNVGFAAAGKNHQQRHDR